MPKPNTYVQLLQAQKAIQQLQHDNHVIKGFTVQQCLDVALIALHNEFHFGPKMTARFESAFLDTFMAYAQMCCRCIWTGGWPMCTKTASPWIRLSGAIRKSNRSPTTGRNRS